MKPTFVTTTQKLVDSEGRIDPKIKSPDLGLLKNSGITASRSATSIEAPLPALLVSRILLMKTGGGKKETLNASFVGDLGADSLDTVKNF
jgi:hypothetical protein